MWSQKEEMKIYHFENAEGVAEDLNKFVGWNKFRIENNMIFLIEKACEEKNLIFDRWSVLYV